MDVSVPLIITGWQTGIDLAATDAAIAAGLQWGGVVPKGRKNEAGVLPERYAAFVDGASGVPLERTRANVDWADAVLILTDGSRSPRTEVTAEYAEETSTPCEVVLIGEGAVPKIKAFLGGYAPEVLNVAGPRLSELGAGDPNRAAVVAARARSLLEKVFSGIVGGSGRG